LNEAAGANDALDLHDGGLTLTQNGSPGSAAGIVYASARTFDGSADYFSRASEAALQAGDVDFAIAAWVYLTSNAADAGVIIKGNGAAAATIEYYLRYQQSTDKFRFIVGNGTSGIGINSAQGPTINAWHLITCWHDATNNLIGIQMDSNAPATGEWTGGAAPTANALLCGVGYAAATNIAYWPGRLGPVSMWKNRTLDAAAIASLWSGGAGLAYSAYTA
jgi:hypothetical protein